MSTISSVTQNPAQSINLTLDNQTKTQTPAQRYAEAQAEARAGVTDGDETQGLGSSVNALA